MTDDSENGQKPDRPVVTFLRDEAAKNAVFVAEMRQLQIEMAAQGQVRPAWQVAGEVFGSSFRGVF